MLENLREFRKRAGLTQVELAEKVGISRTQVTKWEIGETDIKASWINKLAKALGTTPAELLSIKTAQTSAASDKTAAAVSLACSIAIAEMIEPHKLSNAKASKILEKTISYFWDDFKDGNPPTNGQIKKFMLSIIE